jgi:type I restriction enzyme S subunit
MNKAIFDMERLPPELVLEFEKAAFPPDQTIGNNIFQSQTLAAIRDALLPKLLSGEIRIKDAENFLEDKV